MFKTAKIVGLNSDAQASLPFISSRGDPTLLTIVFAKMDDAFTRIRQTLVEIEEVFYSSDQSLSLRIPEIFNLIKDSLKEAEKLEIFLAVAAEDLGGTTFYLFYQGDFVQAYLVRDGKHLDLSAVGGENELASGVLAEGDRVVIMTASLAELLGKEVNIFDQLPLESLEDEVAGRLPQAQICPLSAIVLEKEQIVKPEITEVKPDSQEAVNLRSLAQTFVFKTLSLVPRSKRGLALIGIFLLLIAIIGTVFSYSRQKEAEIKNQIEAGLRKAGEEYDRALALKTVDPAKAAESLEIAKAEIAKVMQLKPDHPRALEIKNQLEGSSKDVLQIFSDFDTTLWLDLDLIKKDFRPQYLSLSHGNLLVLDTEKKALAKINLANKSQEILAGEEKLGKATLASLNGDMALVLSEDRGVVKIDVQNTQVQIVVKPDKDWGKITDLYGFAGNIYLLDEVNSQIWKYVAIASGYSEKRSYLKAEQKGDFADAKRMQIDSSVWVLKGDGEVLKYTQGVADHFAFEGLDKGVKDVKSFFVSDQTDNLYLLDSGNNRLLVLDKKGKYLSQYQSDRMGAFSDLVVDEKSKKVYLLEGNKIFQLALK